jgi:hypothetical protein
MGEGGGLAWAPIAVPPLAAAAGGGDDGRRHGAWRAPAVAGGELPGRPHARATQGRGGALLVQRDSPHLVALPSQNAAASKRPFRAPQMGFPHGCAKSQRSYEIELRSRPGMQRC